MLLGELHRAKKIASNFDIEIKSIVNKYTAARFPGRFAHTIIYNFDSGKDNLIIPHWLFEEREAFTIHLPFSRGNKFCENIYYPAKLFHQRKMQV